MASDALKEYLGIVIDMEQNIYLQKELCREIAEEIVQLQTPKTIIDPPLPTKPPAPSLPAKPNTHESFGLGSIIGGCIVCFFVGGVGGFILGSIIHNIFPLLLCFVLPIWWGITRVQSNNTTSHENYERYQAYERECEAVKAEHQKKEEQYQQKVKEYQAEVEKNQLLRIQDEAERKVKTVFLEQQKGEVEKALATSEEHLQAIYQKDIIHPKYRTFAIVCSLQDYISTGICTTLEGPDGAYKLFEEHMRLDRISTKLDVIIVQLEKIRDNQFMLYSALQESNRLLGQILSSMHQMSSDLGDFYSSSIRSANQLHTQVSEIVSQNAQLSARMAELQKTSKLTAYHTERAQKELSYINRMSYLSGKNDDVFFNRPPV